MNIDNFIKKLQTLTNELNEAREKDTLLVAKEARALIVNRIQNEGKNSDGQQFGNYSTNPLPTFYYEKVASSSQLKKVKATEKKQGKGVSYKQFRQITGRPTNTVNLTYSGEMLANTVAAIEKSDKDSVTAVIKGRTEESKKKLGFNALRYGNILQPSDKEIKQIAKARLDRFLNVVRKVF